MNIETNKPVVVINIPKICVPAETAEVFLQAANRFLADIQDEMIEKYKSGGLKFDNKYYNSEFIPSVTQANTYSDILDMRVDVTQYDKYVLIQTDDYVESSEVYKIWHPDFVEKEETEDEE